MPLDRNAFAMCFTLKNSSVPAKLMDTQYAFIISWLFKSYQNVSEPERTLDAAQISENV